MADRVRAVSGPGGIEAARQLIRELASAAPAAATPERILGVLAGLDRAARQADRDEETARRLGQLADQVFGLASLDFTRRTALRFDGSVLDGVAGCVNMLGEELLAYSEERARTQEVLEARIRDRTADLLRANEELRREVAERARAEEALREREAQLVQASKMAAVGQLAAGVAHELNNPLTVILGFAQGLECRLPGIGPEADLPVTSIVREAIRCRNLVRELLVFSRTAPKTTGPVDLRALLAATGRLLEPRARTQATRLVVEAGAEHVEVRGNPTQLEQVLVNLGNNAFDALGTGGRVSLRLGRAADGRAVLEVQDDGPGIPADVLGRIFEPFFTTKPPGQGTGLGLSLVYEIVRQHGGSLDVRSEPGRGATFELRLPSPGGPS